MSTGVIILLSLAGYILIGFVINLLISMHISKHNHRDHNDICDMWVFGSVVDDLMLTTLLWPIFIILFAWGVVVPKIFLGLYKAFVLIIFLPIGLFKTVFDKGEDN